MTEKSKCWLILLRTILCMNFSAFFIFSLLGPIIKAPEDFRNRQCRSILCPYLSRGGCRGWGALQYLRSYLIQTVWEQDSMQQVRELSYHICGMKQAKFLNELSFSKTFLSLPLEIRNSRKGLEKKGKGDMGNLFCNMIPWGESSSSQL